MSEHTTVTKREWDIWINLIHNLLMIR
jgi:hypothetical protein